MALGRIGVQPNSWKLIGANEFDEAGSAVGIVGDLDGDGRSEVSVGARGFDANEADGIIGAILTWLFGGSQGAVYVVASSDLAAADAADGVAGGRVDLANVISQPNSWRLVGEDESDEVGNRIASVSDLDGDGLAEMLLGARITTPMASPGPEPSIWFPAGTSRKRTLPTAMRTARSIWLRLRRCAATGNLSGRAGRTSVIVWLPRATLTVTLWTS